MSLFEIKMKNLKCTKIKMSKLGTTLNATFLNSFCNLLIKILRRTG